MVSQCRCNMSVLKRQCPRETFDCKRCLTRMKNTGNVWTVDTLGEGFYTFTNPDLVTGPIHAFPPYVHTYEWDAVPANQTPIPEGSQCLSRLAGHSDSGNTPSWGDFVPTDGHTRLLSTIYYDGGNWGLSYLFTHPVGGVIGGYTHSYELIYTSEESRCLIPSTDPGIFTLDSISFDPSDLYYTVPEQINFYHTKIYD